MFQSVHFEYPVHVLFHELVCPSLFLRCTQTHNHSRKSIFQNWEKGYDLYNSPISFAILFPYSIRFQPQGKNSIPLFKNWVSACPLIKNVHKEKKLSNAITKTETKLELKAKLAFRALNLQKVGRKSRFASDMRLFRTLELLIRIGSEITSDFLLVLLIMGVLMASWSGYAMIRLFDQLPLFLYVSVSFVLPVCLGIDFLFATLGAVPQVNGDRFRLCWKQSWIGKLERMQLRACPPIGYSMGPIRLVKRRTALTIADVIFNGVATMCLTDLVK